MAHSPFLQRLISLTNAKKATISKQQERTKLYNRRSFLATTGKAAAAATILAGCSKKIDSPGKVSTQPSIAIIGAGIAGLHAAYILKNAGIASTIYEAGTRTGGRIFTAQNVLAQGLSTELGGEFIDSDHADMRNLAQVFNLPLIDLYDHSDLKLKQNLYYSNGVTYTDDDFLNAIAEYLPQITKDANSLSDIIKYNSFSPTDKKFDSMNLEEYFDSINLHGWLRNILLVAYLGEYGLNTWECNAINFLYLFGTSPEGTVALYGNSDERYKISGGNQKITEALSNELQSYIQTSHQLEKIQSSGSGFELFFTNAKTIKANIVLLTLPFKLLRNVEINVALPPVKMKAINELGYGNNSKLILGFNGRPWRTEYDSVGMTYADNGTQNSWDNTQQQSGSTGGLTVFLGGDDAVKLGNLSSNEQSRKYLNLLEDVYPSLNAYYNNKAYTINWPTMSYAQCGYSAWKVGQYTTIAGSEIETAGNLYFAGEHTSYNFQGYMNGGAATGRKAATNILKAIG